jgi:phosphatidylserine synthase
MNMRKTRYIFSIAFVRAVHTAIFVFFNVVMAVLLYEVVADKISILTWIAVALFAIEGIVLLANNGTCPLTTYTEGLESYHGQVIDIFCLPKWFGDRIFIIYGSLLVVALLLLVMRVFQHSTFSGR